MIYPSHWFANEGYPRNRRVLVSAHHDAHGLRHRPPAAVLPSGDPPEAAAEVAADETRLLRSYLHERFVEMFVSQSRRSQVGLLAAAAPLALTWHHAGGQSAALGWIAALLLLLALRFGYTERFVRQPRAPVRIGLLLLVSGSLMALPLLGFEQFSDIERAGASIILLALAAASAVTTAGFRALFLWFATPMLLPLALAWGLLRPAGDPAGTGSLGIALLIALFLLFLIGLSARVSRVFEEAGRFRYGELRLNRELNAALARADESSRAKTRFLAAASHDLRQPMHSLTVLVAALSLRTQLDAGSREIVELLGRVNQALARQLDGLLDISKLDAGTIRPSLQPHRLDLLLHAQHATMAPAAAERGLRFTLDAAEPLCALTDDALLARILSNLIDNAFKFTPRGGSVRLSLRREGARALLSVADSGVGIAEHERARVFHEFYQVAPDTGASSHTARSQGLGLGLSIVQRLAELLGAQLSLRSAPGAGSCFSLALALADAAPPAVPAAPIAGTIRPGLAVLVVDNEETVRRSMRLLLGSLGCVVHLASSTQQAARIAQRHPIDLVLSDAQLGRGDSGLAAIDAVRRLHLDADAALITGDTEPARLEEAVGANVPLLHKPVQLAQLQALLLRTPPFG